ncbi:hypothetical protein SmJEL517_g02508 [Synchytrium microbalum]|uniref:Chromatin modification-related protein n=1 Tax=Synchytrium microbalum TaxID=1806994 RepID=A0A507C6W5_9FUNG|nr:uncharacterized protein SmJEL517_g02508 [Synchytrium microbalum]TPX35088.1 hypothetical protein SmJEL517_g02508 [Synchytrium microbalum]
MPQDPQEYLEEYIANIDSVHKDIKHVFTELQHKDYVFHELRREIGNLDTTLKKMISTSENTIPSTSKASGSAAPPPPNSTLKTETSVDSDSGKEATPDKGDPAKKEETQVFEEVQKKFNAAQEIANEKIQEVERTRRMIDSYYKKLCDDLNRLTDTNTTGSTRHAQQHSHINTTHISHHSNPIQSTIHPQHPPITPTASYASLFGLNSATIGGTFSSSFSGVDVANQGEGNSTSSRTSQPRRSDGRFASVKGGTSGDHSGSTSPVSVPLPIIMLQAAAGNSSSNVIEKRKSSSSSASVHAPHQQQHQPQHLSSRPRKQKKKTPASDFVYEDEVPRPEELLVQTQGEADDALYCHCQQVSFGKMVACDNDECPIEWFHLGCLGLTEVPSGSWFCSVCSPKKSINPSSTSSSSLHPDQSYTPATSHKKEKSHKRQRTH